MKTKKVKINVKDTVRNSMACNDGCQRAGAQ